MGIDLKDIVDRTRPFSILFSGVETKQYYDILVKHGVKNFLMSYHYVIEKSVDMNKYRYANVKFFIDSGVFTYLTNENFKGKEIPIEFWEEKIQDYLNWAEENKDMIFAIANFDLDDIVGYEKVWEWNKKYFEPFMLRTNIPVCFIWHRSTGLQNWEKMCKRYPYVGFSWVSEGNKGNDLKKAKRLFAIAERYNAVVHGMGMTRTSLLPKLPFYTVDSTSWKAGLRYGLLSFWNGKKVRQVKKDEWDKIKPFVIKSGIDWNKLLEEDVENVVWANAYAYLMAEQFVREKCKNRMYWLKNSSPIKTFDTTNNINLDNIEFPSADWIGGDEQDDWKEWAEKLNIPIKDKNETIGFIECVTVFLKRDDEEYKELYENIVENDEILHELHDLYINKVVNSKEELIDDLYNYFKDVVLGNVKMNSENSNEPLERENYIEEEEYEIKELSEEEVRQELTKILPKALPSGESVAPEIDALDDEIFNQTGIVPIRDEKGRFLKGQKKVKKPKNIYSDKYPKLVCDTCYAAQTCPQFKAGYVCAFNKMFKRFDTRNMDDIIEAMQGMVNLNLERMQRLAIFEMLDGGMPDANLSAMIDQNMRLLINLKQLYDATTPEVLKHTKVVRADGTVEEVTTVNTNPQSGGILEKLFFGGNNSGKKSVEENSVKENSGENFSGKENSGDITLEYEVKEGE